MRASYRAALIEAERTGAAEPPNPFSHGEESFLAWIEHRAVDRLEDRSVDREISVDARELTSALVDRSRLLERIAELEGMREEAIGWAERAGTELEQAKQAIAERDALVRELDNCVQELELELSNRQDVMESIWRSPSWRVTKPMRLAKSLVLRLSSRARSAGR